MMRRQTDGRTDLAMFNQMLDDLEAKRIGLMAQLNVLTTNPRKNVPRASATAPVAFLSLLRVAISSLCESIGHAGGRDDVGKAVSLVRTIIQEVIISPAADKKRDRPPDPRAAGVSPRLAQGMEG
jgi:hypothetical protein